MPSTCTYRQFVNSLQSSLIPFFSGFLKVEFAIQWRQTTVVAFMNALELVMRKSNCITGMIFLELTVKSRVLTRPVL
jgi:hypothetical protein